ncbi:hypothetical protein D0864_06314 [Hortaea werneckii]|uniref:YMC020W-like alpha/beta hydrolase domain-containing protein n=1 Tax=Hortaea werneckii TaxID=91943 RepID=A0A3M7FP88_HORWE|nr:hypothetical protein KC338_g6932 [Hortaea werneckii]KAI6866500.1 hypothetical protein KC323_g3917 [Hortaea werneckii]KAI7350552.1 hypothetical protein KC320_g5427 [Hortaea werneckii]RMY90174.1 hypothetical protein D0864_06314 [Hortaea werneckii]
MARKKSKQSAETPVQPSTRRSDESHPAPSAPQKGAESPAETAGGSASGQPSQRGTSWYSGGSWRSKASPVAQVARESISVAKGATSEASEESSRRPSQSVRKSISGSRKSVPLAAEATRVHATSDASDKSKRRLSSEEKLKDVDGVPDSKNSGKGTVIEEAPLPPGPKGVAETQYTESVRSAEAATRPQSGSWFGWWSRPDGYGSDGEKMKQESNKRRKIETEEASGTPLPGSPKSKPQDVRPDDSQQDNNLKAGAAEAAAQWEGLQPEMSTSNASSRSWFGLWSNAQNKQAVDQIGANKQQREDESQKQTPGVNSATAPSATEQGKPPDELANNNAGKDAEDPPKPAGWAFWSADRTKEQAPTPGGTTKEVGELAVADTPSQSHPEAAQFNEQRDRKSKPEVQRTVSLLRRNRSKDEKAKESLSEASKSLMPLDSKQPSSSTSQISTPTETPPKSDSEAPKPVQRGKLPQQRPNAILPSFQATYPQAPSPGYLERLSSYLTQSLRLTTAPEAVRHVYRTAPSHKVKKAIAIGVHGFFPAQLIQRVLGQPTGTSIRFANYAASALKAWCQEKQPEIKDVEIEKVALEGEGYISDRVSTLWKLLLNWMSHLRQADFILIACHSQGVPVAFMLIAKLIQLGCLSPNVRLGVCAMAGINLGPFLEYKSRLFGGSALELFDFCDSDSKVSKSYVESLDVCLRHGVRVTFTGSIDDQLVSLESSLYAPVSHPYVNRAVFVDGRLHAPNFLTHLVVFALKLRNLGISDHGLLRELSGPLAGSLVGGEGHSRVYDDPAVYRLAIDFALESTEISPSTVAPSPTAASSLLAQDKAKERSVNAARRASLSGYPPTLANANSIRRGSLSASTQLPGIAPVIAHYEPPQSGANANPYYLPWAVRGMLSEDAVKRDEKLSEEVAELVKEFDEWRPTSKVLKDVRWRLEGVKSML